MASLQLEEPLQFCRGDQLRPKRGNGAEKSALQESMNRDVGNAKDRGAFLHGVRQPGNCGGECWRFTLVDFNGPFFFHGPPYSLTSSEQLGHAEFSLSGFLGPRTAGCSPPDSKLRHDAAQVAFIKRVLGIFESLLAPQREKLRNVKRSRLAIRPAAEVERE